MKLKESKFKDVILGASSESTFEIDSESHVIFDILRNKMYSDKIGAICREVSSNGRDANRENGNKDRPIRIRIIEPNQILSVADLSISFEDNGPGITPERMQKIFLKYGSSTKRETDEQTGGFGLGAKTPFAYTDTFTVVTICDWDDKRIKFTYSGMIDSSKKGKMVLFDHEETKEETGTKIIIPIKEGDRSSFESKSLTYTQSWEVVPEYIGFREINSLKVIKSTSDFTIYYMDDSDYRRGGFEKILIDGIPYPIDFSQLENISPLIGGDYRGAFYKFKTGELTISANREAVQYDDETIEAIKSKILQVQSEWQDEITHIISNADSYKEACISKSLLTDSFEKENDLFNFWSDIHKYHPHTFPVPNYWNNLIIASSIHSRYFKFYEVEERSANGRYTTVKTELSKISFEKLDKYPLIALDGLKKNYRRDLSIFEENDVRTYLAIEPMYLEKSPYEVQMKAAENLMQIVDKFDLEYKMYSDYQMAKKTANSGTTSSYQKKSYVTLKVREWSPSNYLYQDVYDSVQLYADRDTNEIGLNCDDEEISNIIGPTIFISCDSIAGYDFRLKDSITRNMKFLKNFLGEKNMPKVYCINERQYEKYVENSSARYDWESTLEKAKKELSKNAKKVVKNHLTMQELQNKFPSNFINNFAKELSSIDCLKNIPLSDLERGVTRQTYIQDDTFKISRNLLSTPIDIDSFREEIRQELEEWKNQYPLLEFVLESHSWRYREVSKEDVTALKEYLKLVASEK